MDIITLLLKQDAIMLIYMGIGFFLLKKNLVSVAGGSELGKILLYVVMPTAIVKSYIKDFSVETFTYFGISFAAAAASLLLAIAVSKIYFGKKDGVEEFGAAFSNAGFIGIPLVRMVLGEEAVFYVSSFVAILNILQWTYGIAVINRSRSRINTQKIIKNPIVISFVLGLLIFFLPIKLPPILTEVMGTISSMNGPLAMIVLGIYLAQISFKELFSGSQAYLCSAVRLFVIPFATILVLSIIPPEYIVIKQTVLIAAAAPVGSNVAIFAQLNNKNYLQAVKDVCMSTLLCIISMPIILRIADCIW